MRLKNHRSLNPNDADRNADFDPDCLGQCRRRFGAIAPTVTLVTNDNWMEFTVRYVVHYKRRRRTKDELFTRILDEFLATEAKVAFASATFQLVEAPTLNVNVRSNSA